ncbi:hypothetical protein KEM56_000169 [Ascosphaera pollenicola]|nr:hypothetical protein KEM56_000169 [Ascosphaera pollenicola]
MRFSLGYVLLAFTATTLAAPAEDASDLAPGTPRYECHSACGNVILLSKESKYCDRDDFAKDLKSCLNCAEEFDTWQYYGKKVAAAAESCDMDSTPKKSTKSDSDKPTTTTATKPSVVTQEVTVMATAKSGASHKGGLAKGAIAGIVISCVVGVAAVIVGTLFFCKRRRNKDGAATTRAPHELSSRDVEWKAGPSVAERRD